MISNIVLKAVIASVALAAIGVGVAVSAGQVARSPYFGGLAPVVSSLAWAIVALAAIPFVSVTARLLLWSHGYGVMCDKCGGPLGREKSGRYGVYRTCLGCGTHRNEKHWIAMERRAP